MEKLFFECPFNLHTAAHVLGINRYDLVRELRALLDGKIDTSETPCLDFMFISDEVVRAHKTAGFDFSKLEEAVSREER